MKLSLKDFENYLASKWDEHSGMIGWTFFGIAFFFFFPLDWKLTFSSTVDTAEFPKFGEILNAALLQSHSLGRFKQLSWNSITSTTLLVVTLRKDHLTSRSSMSGFTWVTPTSSLSGSFWPFLYNYFLHSCYLFSISSASVRSLTFLSFTVPILHEVFLWYLQFSGRDI